MLFGGALRFKITGSENEQKVNRRRSGKVLREGLIQPVSFLMFNRDSEPMASHAGSEGRPTLPSARDSKTNDRTASLRRRRSPQGRTLTSTWGESVGWVKGVNLHRRLIR